MTQTSAIRRTVFPRSPLTWGPARLQTALQRPRHTIINPDIRMTRRDRNAARNMCQAPSPAVKETYDE